MRVPDQGICAECSEEFYLRTPEETRCAICRKHRDVVEALEAEREKVRVLEIEDARKQGVLEAIYESLESPDVYADLEKEREKVRVLRRVLSCADADLQGLLASGEHDAHPGFTTRLEIEDALAATEPGK